RRGGGDASAAAGCDAARRDGRADAGVGVRAGWEALRVLRAGTAGARVGDFPRAPWGRAGAAGFGADARCAGCVVVDRACDRARGDAPGRSVRVKRPGRLLFGAKEVSAHACPLARTKLRKLYNLAKEACQLGPGPALRVRVLYKLRNLAAVRGR